MISLIGYPLWDGIDDESSWGDDSFDYDLGFGSYRFLGDVFNNDIANNDIFYEITHLIRTPQFMMQHIFT